MSFAVRLWTEADFAAGRQAWQSLLADSTADPLFMGWDWQWTWWQHHHERLQAELQLLAVVDSNGRLVGLAPLYVHSTRIKGLLPIRRLECLGTVWHDRDAVFSEYFDFIAARDCVHEVVNAIAGWLESGRQWDDWAISHVRRDALVANLVASGAAWSRGLREAEAAPAHVIDLEGGAGAWLKGLSSDVRRRLHSHRARLQQPEFRLIGSGGVAASLERLQQWRANRHQKAGSGHTVREFEKALAARLAASGTLRLSELISGEQPISVLFNIRLGDTEYYLASAFAPETERGLSPGYLHFGYAIEAACAEGAKRFDLLAGHGRNRDYKADLGSTPLPLRSVQILRAPILQVLRRIAGSS